MLTIIKALLSGVPDLLGKQWKLIAGVVLGALLVAPLAHCTGKRAGKREVNAEYKAAATRLAAANEKQARAADEQRRRSLAAAQARISNDRKDLDDAIRHIPDQAPSARQRAIACASLRAEARRRRAPDPAC